ncbi:MAG: alpha-amylase [Terrimonas sp.]|nr:alpha-amylase [Terrimonas sp.]
MRKNIVAIGIFLLANLLSSAQDIYPTHWWVGMKNPRLQLLIREKDIANKYLSVQVNYPGVTFNNLTRLENPNYIFIDISIARDAKPGQMTLNLVPVKGKTRTLTYELLARNREDGKTRLQGVTAKDVSYLLMPDRFANGDTTNDAFPDMRDTGSDRHNKFARHGGDLKGIKDHLDYFNELGVTALWFTPVIENDMPREHEGNNDMAGYHGYWFTDHYKIDRRLGTNEEYKDLINAAHQKGLKIIQDAIYNHVGLWHWMYQDSPSPDWINCWPTFTGPNHREESMFDPYASKFDKTNMEKGWFTPHLPDVNLDNPFVETFLLQHAIWSAEEFGFDGFRIDTYKYCEENFVNHLNAALQKEFPKVTTFVEAWANTVVANAYFVRNNIQTFFKHNALGAIDFSLCFAMLAGMNQPYGWTEGVNRVYMTLAQDILYKDPMNNCIFLDNHDMDRVFSVVGEDWNKFKWGLNWLFTMRGIPQIYYGTEILMKNFKNPTDAEVRKDFPGGWPQDAVNKFTREGRNEMENTAFDYISKLLHFRKNASAITSGKTMQYIVRDGVYLYFRYDKDQTVMVITNTGNNTFKPDWNIYRERTNGFTKLKNVITGSLVPMEDFSIDPKESYVFELVK